MPTTWRSSGVNALDVSIFTTFWLSVIMILASGNMKYGSAEVMCPMKLGAEVWTDCATTFSSRNSTCSETNIGSSGISVS